MLSAPRYRFFDSVKSRLTLLSGAIIAFTTLAAFLLLYGYLAHALQSNVDQGLFAEFREFQSIYQGGGLDALRREVALEESAKGKSQVFIRAFDGKGGEVLTSDLSYWNPTATTPPDLAREALPVFAGFEDTGSGRHGRSIYGQLAPDLWVLMGVDTEHNEIVLATYRQRCLEVFAVSLLAALFAAWWIARRAMQGVQALTAVAEDITRGEMTRRITNTGHGREIDRLGQVFNTMLARIATLIQEAKGLNDSIAHELRSPLTRIRGVAEMAITNGATLEQHRETVAEIVEACDGLLAMVHSMLAISEMESGVARLDAEPVDCAALVADSCELFEPAAEDRGIKMNVEIAGPAEVFGDRGRLQQAVANLLDNALKYTSSGGGINIRVTHQGDEVLIVVEDTGVGISKQDLPHIFERFYRADRSRSKPGNGLGLGLVQGIVKMHDGRVEARSVLGRGTVFNVHLPAMDSQNIAKGQ
ncbi:MAG TPA: ATP-binding protein [Candidatus Hydrogenedentes bacterium]|nr:ATP-binding protein [Candidatus Hydrogenedentota bacterium]